jgi:hypothetical protein
MKDLRNSRLMWLKGVLLLVIGLISAGLVWMEAPGLKTGLLLALTVWAFCRAYYFAFYVVEKYIDPEFRFAGLISVFRYLLQQSRRRNQADRQSSD